MMMMITAFRAMNVPAATISIAAVGVRSILFIFNFVLNDDDDAIFSCFNRVNRQHVR